VLTRIRKEFEKVHRDKRTKEERQADVELREALKMEESKKLTLLCDPDVVVGGTREGKPKARSTEQTAQILMRVALRSPHVPNHVPRRRTNILGAYYVGDLNDQPSYEDAVKAALRSLERK